MGTKAFGLKTKNYVIEMKTFDYLEKNLESDFYEVGHICGKNFEEILKIVYNVNAYKVFGGHCRLVEYYGFPIIVIDRFFYEKFMKETNFKIPAALFMHELGHLNNGDLAKDMSIDSDKKRLWFLRLGMVMPIEKEADLFAVKELGKSNVINAIDKMISVRKQRNDKAMELAIKEFILRKEIVKKY